jgi:hypothetical protein
VREVDHPAPFSVEVKGEWSCASAAPMRLRDTDRDNFKFLPYLYGVEPTRHYQSILDPYRHSSQVRLLIFFPLNKKVNYSHYRSVGSRGFWEVKASRFRNIGT